MALTVHAVFDGEVLRPDELTSLKPNKRYRLTVEEDATAAPGPDQPQPYPLGVLLDVAEDLGVTDLAVRHDHYARRG
jgi:hypothetical protein